MSFPGNFYAAGLESDCRKCGASNDWTPYWCCDECNEILWFTCNRCGERVYE